MPPRHRSWFLYAGLLVAVLVFWRVAAWSKAEHERSRAEDARLRAAYKQIQKGMTVAQVQAVVGRPPDWTITTGPKMTKCWDVEDRWMAVDFGPSGDVIHKRFKLLGPGPDNDRSLELGSDDD